MDEIIRQAIRYLSADSSLIVNHPELVDKVIEAFLASETNYYPGGKLIALHRRVGERISFLRQADRERLYQEKVTERLWCPGDLPDIIYGYT